MYCKYCGSQISDDSVFCSKCGKSQSSAKTNIKTEVEREQSIKNNFPNIKNLKIETTWNIYAILMTLISIAGLPLSFALARDDMTGGFDDKIMVVVDIILLIICIVNIRKKQYRFFCPRCNKSTTFPCNAQSHDCDCCKSKLILQDNGDITPFQ